MASLKYYFLEVFDVERCKDKLAALDYFKEERELPALPKMDWNRR
jgi:hypothetical protein